MAVDSLMPSNLLLSLGNSLEEKYLTRRSGVRRVMPKDVSYVVFASSFPRSVGTGEGREATGEIPNHAKGTPPRDIFSFTLRRF